MSKRLNILRSGAVNRTPVMLALCLGCLAPLHSAHGQVIGGELSSLGQQFSFTSWKLSGDTTDLTVKQWFLPILVKSDIAPDWQLALSTAAEGTDAKDIQGASISGLTDTRIQASHSMSNNQVLVSGGLSAPTGVTKLSAEKRVLLPWLSADYFNFPVKYPGEGLNLFGEVGAAIPAGDWALGAAGAIHYSGEYTPYDDGRKYQPGARLVGTFGADRDWPGQGHFAADLVLIVSGNDKAEGKKVFADGTQIDMRVSGRKHLGKGRIDAAVRYIARTKNKVLGGENLDLVREANNTNGNDLRFFVSGRRELSPKAQAWLSAEAKFLAANGWAKGDPLYEDAASVMGFGGGADFVLSEHATAGAGIRLWTGSSDGSYAFEPVDLSGFEFIQRLTLTF